MSKKHKHEEAEEEEEVAPFWMISFSDLMTLLLSFFIILFSISTIEQKKMTEVMESMGNRYLTHGNKHAGNKEPTADPNLPRARTPRGNTGEAPKNPPLLENTTMIQDLVVIFQPGRDELNEEGERALVQLAQKLRGRPYPIQVAGHAAQKEIAESTVYRKTDDLAYARAYNAREFLLTQDLKPERFSLVIMGNKPIPRAAPSPAINAYVNVKEVAPEK